MVLFEVVGIRRLSEHLFDFVSKTVVSLKFGNAVGEVFRRYQQETDQKLADLGVENHLKTAYQNLSQDNPAS